MGNKRRAEYFFDYKIERVAGDDSTIQTPKLYFEKDYRKTELPYSMFAVCSEWLNRQNTVLSGINGNHDNEEVKRILNSLPYDTIRFVYDIKGISCAPLTDITSQQYEAAETKQIITFEQFYQAGCQILIVNNNSPDHSGIGVIEMLKTIGGVDKLVARFFFSINFTFRKKIYYEIKTGSNSLKLKFICKDRPVGISVSVVYNRDRLPCLVNDMGVNVVATFELDFSKSKIFKKQLNLTGDAAYNKNIFSITTSDKNCDNYYLLECFNNKTLPKFETKPLYPQVHYTCPYCHKPINNSVVGSPMYRRGGVPCHEVDNKGGKSTPTIVNSNQSKAKNCLYCAKDLKQDDVSTFLNNRLLPSNYLSHDVFKIAFAGSTRAGKTTYISRFFEIIGDQTVSMPMTMTANGLQKFGITIKSVPMLSVDRSEGNAYKQSDINWANSQDQYTSRSICLNPSKYPKPTPNGNYTAYPFITEVNGNTYISFYDIAGEDAQNTMQVKNIANGELIGIFLIINGKTDRDGNNKVINMLKAAANKDKKDEQIRADCPIAVIVTKMDMLENEFDSHCHCLRSDYYSHKRVYEGSSIEYEINYSSEEIKSYLQSMGLLPNFGDENGTKIFNNVKYFCVSSFNFVDSIHNDNEDINGPGTVKFECSSKRIELPFLWMLKQFAVIK